jgi:hypothetical protein
VSRTLLHFISVLQSYIPSLSWLKMGTQFLLPTIDHHRATLHLLAGSQHPAAAAAAGLRCFGLTQGRFAAGDNLFILAAQFG